MPYKTSAQKMMGFQKINSEANTIKLKSEEYLSVYELSEDEIRVVEGVGN